MVQPLVKVSGPGDHRTRSRARYSRASITPRCHFETILRHASCVQFQMSSSCDFSASSYATSTIVRERSSTTSALVRKRSTATSAVERERIPATGYEMSSMSPISTSAFYWERPVTIFERWVVDAQSASTSDPI